MFPIASNSDDETLYSDSVFSTYLYTGNGSTQTITNGIDLAGNGGLVWTKLRSDGGVQGVQNHTLLSSDVGLTKFLYTNTTAGAAEQGLTMLSYASNGYSIQNTNPRLNYNSFPYVSWTFRKAKKFFDVVTYTGTAPTPTLIPHNLGVTPGMIIVKAIGTTSNWYVWHRNTGPGDARTGFELNSTSNAKVIAMNTYNPDETVFRSDTAMDSSYVAANANGVQYVAYLFAHDTSSTGIIQCGSYTGNGNTIGSMVNLGWEPQYVLIKSSTGTSSQGDQWAIFDSMRGITVDGATPILLAESAGTEYSDPTIYKYLSIQSTGFKPVIGNPTYAPSYLNTSGEKYIYMAIRRPNKPPTSGTQVYNAIARTGTDAPATVSGFNFPVDLTWHGQRAGVYGSSNVTSWDRLRGAKAELYTGRTDAEGARNGVTSFAYMDAVEVSNPTTAGEVNYPAGNTGIFWGFKRAPGFFDVVCFTGTGAVMAISHSLGVAPELMIVKSRSNAFDWRVWHKDVSFLGSLNGNGYFVSNLGYINSTLPTNTQFTVNGAYDEVGGSGYTYVAYLFATLAGISKVGSYTGNGTSQNIECGFAAGARFVLVKATSTTGDWLVADTARGIVSGNDPRLSLNSTAAEVTGEDWLDPYAPGFTVNQTTASANASGVSYIFLAIS